MTKGVIGKIVGGSLLAAAFCISGITFGNNVSAISGTIGEDWGDLYITWTIEDNTLTIGCSKNTLCKITTENPWSSYKDDIKKIVINDGIDIISKNVFENYTNLEELVLPKSMGGEIAEYAFYNCAKLKEVTLPIGMSHIGQYAFYGTSITKVDIPIYLSWIEDNAFNEGTELNYLIEGTDLIAAGTAGKHSAGIYLSTSQEGRPENDTCYIKQEHATYWDDTAYWRLYKDGTLVIWGTELAIGYSNSRVPWGCYKDQIKTAIFNDDKTGTLTKRNKLDNSELLPNATYAIYATKPVAEIMNNRIKEINGAQFWDCRGDCKLGFKNLETIIINRGVETLGYAATNNQEIPDASRDIYISKYVKNIDDTQFYIIGDASNERVHIETSYDDYTANNYNYKKLTTEQGFIETYVPSYWATGSTIVNDINQYYVSVNDTSAPETITHNSQTLYHYQTYITKDDGSVDVSLPNMEDVEYYVREIKAPAGFQVDPDVYKVDMSGKNIDIQVANYPIGYQDPANRPKQAKTEKNPNTATSTPALYFALFGALSASAFLIGRRISKLAK